MLVKVELWESGALVEIGGNWNENRFVGLGQNKNGIVVSGGGTDVRRSLR